MNSAEPTRDLFSHLRHDLRTPINHILGYADLVFEELQDSGSKDQAEDLIKIRQAAESLLGLINTNLTPEGIKALSDGAQVLAGASTGIGYHPAQDQETLAPIPGRILVVDDSPANRETLCRRLRRQGHTTQEAADGVEALATANPEMFDLVLLDVIMPKLDGYNALREMKADPVLKEIPVIMISALDELGSVVRCIEAGAEDYLAKPFEPTLLKARIGASLEKKRLRDQEREHLRTIETTQKRLAGELEEAGNYVRSILPPPVKDAPIRVDWRFLPSHELGGDSFGYHWIDDEHFAFYLLDVCGHGVGAALLSVAAINVLRSGSLAADFRDPGSVLSLLNETFPMERHNNMYFTLWYGVYHQPTRTLRHASGGHPPAFLLAEGEPMQALRCPGLVVGILPGMEYDSETCTIPPGARLYVMSDGTYEIRTPEGILDFAQFEAFFRDHGDEPDFLDQLIHWATRHHGSLPLEDDFSIIRIDFPPTAHGRADAPA